jgi:hypothetical protein
LRDGLVVDLFPNAHGRCRLEVCVRMLINFVVDRDAAVPAFQSDLAAIFDIFQRQVAIENFLDDRIAIAIIGPEVERRVGRGARHGCVNDATDGTPAAETKKSM